MPEGVLMVSSLDFIPARTGLESDQFIELQSSWEDLILLHLNHIKVPASKGE